jgi:STE24 endopeptidase
VNEDKATRYHRLHRRAFLLDSAAVAVVLAAFIAGGGSLALRDLAVRIGGGGPSSPYTVALYVLALMPGYQALSLPIVWYQGFLLERRYGLGTATLSTWLIDYGKATVLLTLAAVPAAVVAYTTMQWWPWAWWLACAVCFAVALAGIAQLLPIALLPLFYRLEPLGRPELRGRLMSLCERARVPVLGCYVWRLGDKSRRVNAALVGAGSTRRILLSDTLLADYSDDEIEVILAHELAHHVHADFRTGLLVEFARLMVMLGAGSLMLRAGWKRFDLIDPADVAGLPLLAGAGLLVALATGPILNAWSRRNERRADAFALALTARPAAFRSVMRRMAAQNLAEERPSRAALWFFHTHPPVEQRIDQARRFEERPITGPPAAPACCDTARPGTDCSRT